MRVNLRGLGLYAEDLSRRDSVKVAQYEVLGNGAKRRVRPAVASLWRGLRARRSSKSEGGILTTADRPGRIAV